MASDEAASGAGRSGRQRSRASELTGELPVTITEQLERAQPHRLSDDDLEVVQALRDLGVDEDDARQAVVDNRVPLVLVQQIYGEQRELSLDELADESGVPADVLAEVRTALGLPVRETYGDTELAWAQHVAELLELVPVDAVVSGARGRGQAAFAIAMSDLTIVRDELVLPMRQSGADDLTVAVALAETAKALEPVTTRLIELTHRMVVEHLLSTEIAAMAARGNQAQLDLAVGFADVVGYTALSARVDPEGLDEVLDAFDRRVIDVVGGDERVGVVKYLGDAVMLVASDAASLANALLGLVERREDLEDTPLRAGMAAGPTLVREGDLFGTPVNLAARLTDQARSWSVLAAEDLESDLTPAFEVKRILPTRLRGFGLSRPLVVRRSGWDERG